MAALEKIRVKFGVLISVVIALALLSFIIDPGTLQSVMQSMSSKYDVGSIAGKNISYQDFQSDVDRYTTINEILTGSSAQSEQAQKQIRDAAWQELVDRYMFIKNARNAGITVGEDEMVELMTGENVSPIISQNPIFFDENGNYSSARLVEFVQSVNSDVSGQAKTYWDYLQNTVYNQQYYTKYGSLFAASNYLNALQLEEDVAAGNTTVDVDYVLSYYPVMSNDSTINVSSKEIKAYYNAHKDFFKQTASRDIEYVVFEVVPSDSDIAAASQSMDDCYDEFSTTGNMKTFLLRNSERALSTYWYKAGELNTISSELNDYVFNGRDETTPVVRNGNSFYAAREMASAMVPDSVFVKHILLQDANAAYVADSLVNVIRKGENFSNLAAQYSADQNAAADGELGSLGWMTQTYMIPGFESVITAAVGQPFVLNTQYGTHVVLVSRKTAPVAKKQVAILEKTAIASKETFNNFYAQANTFATITAGSYEGYKRAVDSTRIYSHSINITEATSSYGSIDNAKEITRWAFDQKKGKASEIITVNNNFFFIAAVKDTHKEGLAPVKEVAASIQSKLYRDKVEAKALAEAREKIKGAATIEAVAEALGSSVEHRDGMSLASTQSDPALIGAIANAREGVITGPVAGTIGIYVVNVTNREQGSFYSETDARNLATQKAQYMSQMIVPVMEVYDGVEDNRARFF